MKKILGMLLVLICMINVQVSAEKRSYKFAYDLEGRRVCEVYVLLSDLICEDSNANIVIADDDETRIDIEPAILSEAKENEHLIILDLKTDNEENPYPEIEPLDVIIQTTITTGGGRIMLLGKDYRLCYFNENYIHDLSDNITESYSRGLTFTVNKLGKYVIYLNPAVYDVIFYLEEPIYDEEGELINSECIYREIKDLNRKEIVQFPTIPEKEGYVFTGWKCRTQSGRFYFSETQPLVANNSYEYYASWCPVDEYEPINIEISSSEPIIKGKEDGKKITLKTNYGVFVNEDEFPTEWRTAYNEETDEQAKADLLTDWKSKWNVVGADDVMIETATRIDDKTVELVLSGNSDDIYKNSEIQIEFNSELLMAEPYEIDGEIIDWDDTKIKMDEDGVRARMYRSDNSIKLSKQSRPGGNAGLGVPKYTVTFETNGAGEIPKQTLNKNTLAKMPESPQKENYVFSGWYSDEELTQEFDFSEKVTKNITLFAKWDEIDDAKNQIVLTIGKKEAVVFGEEKENDAAPLIRDDRAYLPVRFVAESLGGKVSWNGEKQQVTITKDDVEIIITIGEKTALVNDVITEFDSPVFIENYRTYTPIRFIAEKFGCDVDWNPEGQIITITK